ncbi:rCG58002 [Rattus norvegicus]|uniref:RCG58002 n=1 Tax=Rattus norvegicus TaxID=10116 RepID=A6J3Z9_RAT|nr:rCG58002 [Rattus norvegicus]
MPLPPSGPPRSCPVPSSWAHPLLQSTFTEALLSTWPTLESFVEGT